ncbi:Transcription repressor OFP8 [Hirschfeldia incana]|nr:Transcription repressor OFP8 [Hirschfeldia incana]
MRLRVPRIVRSSLSSCRPRDLHDVVDTSAVASQTTSSDRFFLTEPKAKPPRVDRHKPKPNTFSAFPPNPFYEGNRSFRDLRKNIKTKRKQRSSQFASDSLLTSRFKSSGSWCWSSSEDEEEESDDRDTLFSSRSFSSESSKGESFAVVKKSEDPYEDFRTSMVEMIVERQIFAAAELQKLLQCFLSLNSLQHHNLVLLRRGEAGRVRFTLAPTPEALLFSLLYLLFLLPCCGFSCSLRFVEVLCRVVRSASSLSRGAPIPVLAILDLGVETRREVWLLSARSALRVLQVAP